MADNIFQRIASFIMKCCNPETDNANEIVSYVQTTTEANTFEEIDLEEIPDEPVTYDLNFTENSYTLIYKGGNQYISESKVKIREGKGKYLFCDSGNIYNGEWKDNKKHGKVVFISANNLVDEEEDNTVKNIYDTFKKGKLGLAQGDFFICEWENDKKEGIGLSQFLDPKKPILITKYKNNKPCGAKYFVINNYHKVPGGEVGIYTKAACEKSDKIELKDIKESDLKNYIDNYQTLYSNFKSHEDILEKILPFQPAPIQNTLKIFTREETNSKNAPSSQINLKKHATISFQIALH